MDKSTKKKEPSTRDTAEEGEGKSQSALPIAIGFGVVLALVVLYGFLA